MALWQGFQPQPIDIFGGLVTNIDRMDLPGNVSPNCQDVEFFVGGVKSRRGTLNLGSFTVSGESVMNMFRAWTPGIGPYTACYYSTLAGSAVTDGQLNFLDISGTQLPGTPSFTNLNTTGMNAAPQYGKLWCTFWHNQPTAYMSGTTPPRCFDYNNSATNFYRVGLQRPFWADAVATEVASTGNTMTAGTHLFRVTFEFADGSTSPISGPLSLVSTGGPNTAAQIANIPLGPVGTVRRVIWAASVTDSAIANTQNYFTLRASAMVIPDNTTTTQVFAFTDNVLTAGESAMTDGLFVLMPPPPAKGVVFYKNRAFWYHLTGAVQPGWQNALSWWDGLEFTEDTNTAFRGWLSAGTGLSIVNGTSGVPKLLRMTADGATATYCVLVSRALSEAQQGTVPALKPGRKYGLGFRIRRGSTVFTQGSLRITSNISGYSFNYDVDLTTLTTAWNFQLTGALIANFDYNTAAKNPKFTVEFINTAKPNLAYVEIEGFHVYDTENPYQGSLVLASQPSLPGTCRGDNGLMLVAKDNGEQINAAFVLRDNLYFVKNNSLWVTTDNGVTEPGGWSIQQVSNTVGAMSPTSVCVGDNFVVIAAKDGLYYFDGGAPQKLSNEIQPTWARIPLAYMAEISIAIDAAKKQIIVNVPLDNETLPAHQLVLDYVEGFGDPLESGGHGRKWTIWNIPAASVVQADGGFSQAYKMLYGCNDTSGRVRYQTTSSVSDPGAAINAYYETSPVGVQEGVTLFGGILFWASGSGTFTLSYTAPNNANTTINTFTLADPATRNWQQGLNIYQYEKVGFRFGTNSASDYWSLNRLTPFFAPNPHMNIRGRNP